MAYTRVNGRSRTTVLIGDLNAGAVSKETRRERYNSAYMIRTKGKIPCPRCGKAMHADPEKRIPHKMPRPNNFLQCLDADGKP
jgi:hypothetical protein